MKIDLVEHGGCFSFNMTPETLADAALLMRLKMNTTNKVRASYACAHADGTIDGALVLAKTRRTRNEIR